MRPPAERRKVTPPPSTLPPSAAEKRSGSAVGVRTTCQVVRRRWRRGSARSGPPVLRKPAGESRDFQADGGAARGPVDQHDGPDLTHRVEADGAGEPRNPAVVPDPGHLVPAGSAPGNAPGLRPLVIGQVTRLVHLAQRPGVQHLAGRSRRPVGPELERNPAGQVRGGRPQAAFRPGRRHRRRRVQVVRQAAPVVSRRAPGPQLTGQRREGGRGHAERAEDGVPDVLRVRGSAGPGHDLAEPLVGEVGVGVLRVRREPHGDLAGPPQGHLRRALVGRDGPVRARRLGREPRLMRQHPPDGHPVNRTERAYHRAQFRQPRHRRVVETEPARVPQLHDRRTGERLGDRRDAVEHRRIGGLPGGHLGEPGTGQPGELVPAHHARHRPRQPVPPGERGEPGLQVRSGRRDQSRLVHPVMVAEPHRARQALPGGQRIHPAASADPSCAREVMPSFGKIR